MRDEERDWQLIETAPRDGTRIQAGQFDSTGVYFRQFVCFWNPGWKGMEGVLDSGPFWQAGGLLEHPTHWMPLVDWPNQRTPSALAVSKERSAALHLALEGLLHAYRNLMDDRNAWPQFVSEDDPDQIAERALTENMPDYKPKMLPVEAINHLIHHQEQCDMEGIMIKVSRQALDEVLQYLAPTPESAS